MYGVESDEYDMLRSFVCDITVEVDGGGVDESDANDYDHTFECLTVGTVIGYVGLKVAGAMSDLCLACDCISSDAEPLDATTVQIDEWLTELGSTGVGDAILIDRVSIKPAYRGNWLLGRITSEIVATLRLNPETTIAVTRPEPQQPGGGPLPGRPGA